MSERCGERRSTRRTAPVSWPNACRCASPPLRGRGISTRSSEGTKPRRITGERRRTPSFANAYIAVQTQPVAYLEGGNEGAGASIGQRVTADAACCVCRGREELGDKTSPQISRSPRRVTGGPTIMGEMSAGPLPIPSRSVPPAPQGEIRRGAFPQQGTKQHLPSRGDSMECLQRAKIRSASGLQSAHVGYTEVGETVTAPLNSVIYSGDALDATAPLIQGDLSH